MGKAYVSERLLLEVEGDYQRVIKVCLEYFKTDDQKEDFLKYLYFSDSGFASPKVDADSFEWIKETLGL